MMTVENQRLMAFEGLQTWAHTILVQVNRIDRIVESMRAESGSAEFANIRRSFAAERHLFLIAAFKLVEHIDWAKTLSFLEDQLFGEFETLGPTIKTMRDLNEHAIEYFIGRGRFPEQWTHIDESSIADASSTVNDRIGNRLNWHDVALASRKLIETLPPQYRPSE